MNARRKFTFVIGAGASHELGLPLGVELKSIISGLLNIQFDGHKQASGDFSIAQAWEILAKELNLADGFNDFRRAALKIRDAMNLTISIDNFIDSHKGDQKIEICGKLAIVKSILDVEKKSSLYWLGKNSNRGMDFFAIAGSWLVPFFKILSENCQVSELEKRLARISFVIFNYDRCVEHFLYHALQCFYPLDKRDVAILLRGVNFYHPYGVTGSLPWQDCDSPTEFGAELQPAMLLSSARKIKTFTEGMDPESSQIGEIRNSVSTADVVVFLGFAFHRINMDLIGVKSEHHKRIEGRENFATFHGILNYDKSIIVEEISAIRGCDDRQIHCGGLNTTCSQLFSEYTRGISLV